jgi:hypothetical protein
MKDCLAFSYNSSVRIRLRECAEINLLSFSRLLDTIRRSEEYQRCRPKLAVPLAVCQLANLLQHSNDLQAATRTSEQAIILKIDSSLNNQESYRQSSS